MNKRKIRISENNCVVCHPEQSRPMKNGEIVLYCDEHFKNIKLGPINTNIEYNENPICRDCLSGSGQCEKHRVISPDTIEFITKDSGKRVDFPSGMRRDTQDNKPRFNLIYFPLLKRWAELMTRGAEKYGENNWRLANSLEELERFKESALRHL